MSSSRGKTTPASTPGSFAPHSHSDSEVALSALEPLVPDPGAPYSEFTRYPDVQHPLHAGLRYGITYSETFDDFAADCGYYGTQPQPGTVGADEPPRWVASAPDFATAALLWQHRDDITAALAELHLPAQGNYYRDDPSVRRRLRVDVEPDRFIVSEYDYGEFRGIVVPRRDQQRTS